MSPRTNGNTVATLGLVLAVLGIIGLIVSLPAMAHRLSHREIRQVWFHSPVPAPKFEFKGEPAEIRPIDPADAGALPAIDIVYRGATHRILIEPGMRDDPRLPGLLRYEDWLRVLLFAEGGNEKELDALIESGQVRPRLVVATRRPALGYEPGSWGSVRRKEWRYAFVELIPADAPGDPLILHEGTYAELDKLVDPKYRQEKGLEADLWKYYAMQHVTPPTLFRARSRPIQEAMEAMGWTWPVAGTSVLLFVVGLIARGVGRAGRREPADV